MSVNNDCTDIDDGIDLGNKNFKPTRNKQKICKFVKNIYKLKSESDQCEYEINTRDELLLIDAQD